MYLCIIPKRDYNIHLVLLIHHRGIRVYQHCNVKNGAGSGQHIVPKFCPPFSHHPEETSDGTVKSPYNGPSI